MCKFFCAIIQVIKEEIILSELKIPKHIAIIMDGNGRWADKRFLPKKAGHRKGADVLENILRCSNKFGVKYLSAYAFSTENWNRPQDEVNDLMDLLDNYLDRYIEKCDENGLKIKCIGDISKLSDALQKKILKLEALTEKKNGLNFIIALNYGARDEIFRAVKKILNMVLDKKILPNEITKSIFESCLDTKNIPDPDLLIRTGGEMRISNFLLWQCAYTEFYFCDKFWPDFNENDLEDAIKNFSMRQRRFGSR